MLRLQVYRHQEAVRAAAPVHRACHALQAMQVTKVSEEAVWALTGFMFGINPKCGEAQIKC